MSAYIDIVFDGPPGHEAGRFVEVENAEGRSINAGQWLQRADGYWVLRIRALRTPASAVLPGARSAEAPLNPQSPKGNPNPV